jgi:hypothetical protein
MICIWLFENLVPLCITDSYYPNFFDDLLDTQFFDIGIDNLSDCERDFKKSYPTVIKMK